MSFEEAEDSSLIVEHQGFGVCVRQDEWALLTPW